MSDEQPQLPGIPEPPVDAIGNDSGNDVPFNWADGEDIVLYEQPETAIYFNRIGAMVIRQRGWPDDDSFIFIQPQFITEFLEQAAAKWREQK